MGGDDAEGSRLKLPIREPLNRDVKTMSKHTPTHPLLALTRVWFDCALEASVLLAHGSSGLREARRLRARWFSGLSDVADQTMRTAGFLELMGLTLHTMSTPVARSLRAPRLVSVQGGRSGGAR